MTLSLEEISDRLEIEELYARYVHAVDDHEFEPLERIFVPETIFDWTQSGGERTTWAVAKDGPFLKGELFPYIFHVCVNVRIDFAPDHQSAAVKSKTIHPTGVKNTKGEPVLFQVQGVYTDRLVKTAEGWRILERVWKDFWAVGGLTWGGGIPDMLAKAAE